MVLAFEGETDVASQRSLVDRDDVVAADDARLDVNVAHQSSIKEWANEFVEVVAARLLQDSRVLFASQLLLVQIQGAGDGDGARPRSSTEPSRPSLTA